MKWTLVMLSVLAKHLAKKFAARSFASTLRMTRNELLAALLICPTTAIASPIPDDFPRFIVPGNQKEMDSLRELFWMHYQRPGPFATIWDQWIPEAVLWPATSQR